METNTKFNTNSMLNEINMILQNGLNNILSDFTFEYNKYKKTHEDLLEFVDKVVQPKHLHTVSTKFIPFPIEKEYNVKPFVNVVSNQSLITEISENNDSFEIEYRNMNMNISEVTNIFREEMKEIKINSEKQNKIIDELLIMNRFFQTEILSLKEEIKSLNKANVVQENITLEIKETVKIDSIEQTQLLDNNQEYEVMDEVTDPDGEEEEMEIEEEFKELKVEVNQEAETQTEELEVKEEIETQTEEVEVKEEIEISDEEEELFEIEIDDITYYTNNEENGIIYEVTKDEEVGKEVGYLKDGEPYFH